MKIVFIVLLAVSIVFSFAACVSSNSAPQTQTDTNAGNADAQAARAESRFDEDKKTSGKDEAPKATPKTAAKQTADNFVCPEPDKPCHHKERRFEEWELPFRLTAKIK